MNGHINSCRIFTHISCLVIINYGLELIILFGHHGNKMKITPFYSIYFLRILYLFYCLRVHSKLNGIIFLRL